MQRVVQLPERRDLRVAVGLPAEGVLVQRQVAGLGARPRDVVLRQVRLEARLPQMPVLVDAEVGVDRVDQAPPDPGPVAVEALDQRRIHGDAVALDDRRVGHVAAAEERLGERRPRVVRRRQQLGQQHHQGVDVALAVVHQVALLVFGEGPAADGDVARISFFSSAPIVGRPK